jgi:hypothetical protein
MGIKVIGEIAAIETIATIGGIVFFCLYKYTKFWGESQVFWGFFLMVLLLEGCLRVAVLVGGGCLIF